MEYSYESSEDVGMLVLNGRLTIDRAAELKKLLIESMDRANHVIVQVENVTEVDLSCLQLLCSAHRTAVCLKKNLVLNRPGNGIFTDSVKAAGYLRSNPCDLSIGKSCLWVGL